jgi:tripartite-type tricarboxylate transporter receptor subunit TctC
VSPVATTSRRRFIAALGAAAVAGVPFAGRAADPQVLRWVLGFSVGGGTDALARSLAPRVGERLGAAVTIDNRPGANGNLAAQMVAHATPDGSTLLLNTSSLVVSPALYTKPGYDPFRDFVPVSAIANVPLLLVAHPSVPAKTLAEFIAYAKAHADTLLYASAGNGNSTHLANLMFQQAVGIRATHVPYKGGGPALNDLLAGHVHFYMDTANTALPHVKNGMLRALATAGMTRLPALPEVPTIAEAAAPGFEAGSWTGLVAPAGTRADRIAQVHEAVQQALQDPSTAAILAQHAAEPRLWSTARYGEYLRSESERWGALVRKHGIHIE